MTVEMLWGHKRKTEAGNLEQTKHFENFFLCNMYENLDSKGTGYTVNKECDKIVTINS